MKMLCALAASLIIGAASFGAQAGDRHRHDDHRHHAHERHCDDWRGHRHVVVREYRPVYYRPAPVRYYSGPARYYSGPVHYYSGPVERVHYRDYRGDGDIHGSISIGF